MINNEQNKFQSNIATNIIGKVKNKSSIQNHSLSFFNKFMYLYFNILVTMNSVVGASVNESLNKTWLPLVFNQRKVITFEETNEGSLWN